MLVHACAPPSHPAILVDVFSFETFPRAAPAEIKTSVVCNDFINPFEPWLVLLGVPAQYLGAYGIVTTYYYSISGAFPQLACFLISIWDKHIFLGTTAPAMLLVI